MKAFPWRIDKMSEVVNGDDRRSFSSLTVYWLCYIYHETVVGMIEISKVCY